jgi:hypothetical protein
MHPASQTLAAVVGVVIGARDVGIMYIDNARRKVVVDQRFAGDESNAQYDNHIFIRLSAKGRAFRDVDFKYATFDTCYFRDATFDSCNFTGCRFISTNLQGAKFSGCRFEYATFERTIIDSVILETESPSHENLRMRFARYLRINYQQLGDAAAVNKAMSVELESTRTHLYKSWASEQLYYRKKYQGFERFKEFIRWVAFSASDLVWGNGENAYRLIRAMLSVVVFMTVYEVVFFRDPHVVDNYLAALQDSVDIFIGVPATLEYPPIYIAIVTLLRLLSIGLLLSIVIKKTNRR